MLLTLADLVFQIPPARVVIQRALLSKGYTPESAFQLWHSCLLWWSFKVPAAYLAVTTLFLIGKTIAPDFWPLSFGFAGALVMALISSLRLLPVRDETFEKSDWQQPDA